MTPGKRDTVLVSSLIQNHSNFLVYIAIVEQEVIS